MAGMSRYAPTDAPIPVTPPVRSRSVWQAFWRMERWKKLVLTIALLVGVIGAAGSIVGATRPAPAPSVQAQQTIEDLKVPAGSQLTDTQQARLDQAKQTVSNYGHWFYDKTAPVLWRVGFSFAVAFVLGIAARSFVKSIAFFVAGVLVIATALAYFKVLDLGQFRDNLTNSTGWAADQMKGLKDLAVKTIGFSLTGVVGFVLGFLKK